jgi:hypothetical protein
MICTHNTCECKPKEYHDFQTLSCLAQKSINEKCYLDKMCQSDKYLQCQNEKCECMSSKPTWSPNLDRCLGIGSYNDPCVTVNDCDGSKLLVCNSESVSCNCHRNVSENYCDCPKRSIGSEFYWDGKECIEASGFGESCNVLSYECKMLTEGTECINGINGFTCNCKSTQFFNFDYLKCENLINNTTTPCKQSGNNSIQNAI